MRHYEVNSYAAMAEVQRQLEAEWGGVWALGSSHSYPEDYTIVQWPFYNLIRRGDAGNREEVALIHVDTTRTERIVRRD